jgi:hypothetical protein
MPIEEPNTWLQGATALQTGFGAVPSVVGLVRDTEKAPCGGKVHNKVHKKFIDQPLDHPLAWRPRKPRFRRRKDTCSANAISRQRSYSR